jgi:hypothetical protein
VWFRRKQPKDLSDGAGESMTDGGNPATPFPANLAHAIAWGASLESVGYEWPPKADSPSDGGEVEEAATDQ